MNATIADTLHRLGILFARSEDGFSEDEAKDLFFKFHKKDKVDRSELEPGEDPEGEPVQKQMMTFMRETADKLDRIEDDIDYLKKQVDTILKKI